METLKLSACRGAGCLLPHLAGKLIEWKQALNLDITLNPFDLHLAGKLHWMETNEWLKEDLVSKTSHQAGKLIEWFPEKKMEEGRVDSPSGEINWMETPLPLEGTGSLGYSPTSLGKLIEWKRVYLSIIPVTSTPPLAGEVIEWKRSRFFPLYWQSKLPTSLGNNWMETLALSRQEWRS